VDFKFALRRAINPGSDNLEQSIPATSFSSMKCPTLRWSCRDRYYFVFNRYGLACFLGEHWYWVNHRGSVSMLYQRVYGSRLWWRYLFFILHWSSYLVNSANLYVACLGAVWARNYLTSSNSQSQVGMSSVSNNLKPETLATQCHWATKLSQLFFFTILVLYGHSLLVAGSGVTSITIQLQ